MNGPRRTPLHNPNADASTVRRHRPHCRDGRRGRLGRRRARSPGRAHQRRRSRNPFTWAERSGQRRLALADGRHLVGGGGRGPGTGPGAGGRRAVMRWQAGRVYVDTRARLLGRDRPACAATWTQGRPGGGEHGAGLQSAVTCSGRMVRATWEDTMVVIAGARMGKTTSMAVPQVLDAPGVVYCTSNKRDLYDSTTRARRAQGRCVAVRPPRHRRHRAALVLVGPLDACRTIAAARRTADVFATASRPPNASRDAYSTRPVRSCSPATCWPPLPGESRSPPCTPGWPTAATRRRAPPPRPAMTPGRRSRCHHAPA